MTADLSILLDKNHVLHSSPIITADGSQLHVNYIGLMSTSNLSLPATFHVPNLIINLIFVGQIYNLGLNVIFSFFGCHV